MMHPSFGLPNHNIAYIIQQIQWGTIPLDNTNKTKNCPGGVSHVYFSSGLPSEDKSGTVTLNKKRGTIISKVPPGGVSHVHPSLRFS